MHLLEVKNIQIKFDTPDGDVQAVNEVSFNLNNKESLAIVGESGAGKTQLVFSILGLLSKNSSVSGSIRFNSKEILNLTFIFFTSSKCIYLSFGSKASLSPSPIKKKEKREITNKNKGNNNCQIVP